MHYPSLLAVVAAATSTLVAAAPIPLDYVYEREPNMYDRASRKGHERIRDAVKEANRQIGHMDSVFTAARADPNGREADITRQAFGRHAMQPDNVAKIQDTIDKMKSNAPQDRMRLHSSRPDKDELEYHRIKMAASQNFINSQPKADRPMLQQEMGPHTVQWESLNGMTEVRHDWGTHKEETGKIMFGTQFHADKPNQSKAYRTEYRAGAVIHEYAHQHGHASDDAMVHRGGRVGEVIVMNKNPTMSRGATKKESVGYANTSTRPIRSEKDLKGSFKDMRKTSPNMSWNADSYRVMAGLSKSHIEGCAPHEVRKRALLEEDPVSYYLAKRQACQMSPDHFKKKAEAKAAAANPKKATSPAARGGAKTGARAAKDKSPKVVKPSRANRRVKAKTTRARVPKSPKKSRAGASRGRVAKPVKKVTAPKGKTTRAAARTTRGKKSVAPKKSRAGASRGRVTKPVKKATAPKRTPKTASRSEVKKASAPKVSAPKAKAAAPKRVKKGGKARRSLLDELD